ncbi:MAG: hypothetical protein HQK83_12080 [Fibrobacteria bacterium]|nr:hypothetical protein [Fibrobacteria bacterium]
MNFKSTRFLKQSSSLLIVLSFCISSLFGQVTFTKYPIDKQLYARDLTTGLADVSFEGTVEKTSDNYTQISLTIYRDNERQGEPLVTALTYNGSTAPFSIVHKIKAELANYKFEVHLKNASKTQLVKTVNEVVAGDAFIIQGQSNASAGVKASSTNVGIYNSPFIRVFGTGDNEESKDWFIALGHEGSRDQGGAGQWGLTFAKQIVDAYKIPVCLFNGALGGAATNVFYRNDSDPYDFGSNYGRMLTRVTKTGLQNSIRAILWYQGESDAINGNSTEGYKNVFYNKIYGGWVKDFPGVEKTYVFQIRTGCGGSEADVMNIKEAHRQIGEENPAIETMSTSNSPHWSDNCHYEFAKGYERTGLNIFRLVNRDLYGKIGEKNIEPPRIQWAEHWGTNEIRLIMKNPGDSLIWFSGAQNEFRLDGTGANVSSGKTWRNHVILTMSTNASSATAISYVGEKRTAEAPMVKTPNEVGAMHFYQFPITKPYMRDSSNVKVILDSNKVQLTVSQVSETDVDGRINKLLLNGLALTDIPGSIGYLDAVTTIRLDSSNIQSLPEDIVHLTPTTHLSVNNNQLCQISADIQGWIDTFAADKNWRSTQQHCSSGIRKSAQVAKQSFIKILSGKQIKISVPNVEAGAIVKIYNLTGKVISHLNISSGISETVWMVPERLTGVFFVKLDWQGNTHTEHIFLQGW